MTKFQQALEKGSPLVILLDFEMFDAAGSVTAQHSFSMNWYADAERQYDDGVMDCRVMMRLLGDFGSSGLPELTESALRLSDSATLDALREDNAAAEQTTVLIRLGAGGMLIGDFVRCGRYEVRRLNEEDDGSLTADLDVLNRGLFKRRIGLSKYLGLDEALYGLQSGPIIVFDPELGEDHGDPRLNPSQALLIGAWIKLDTTAVNPAVLARRYASPGSSTVALDFVIRSDKRLAASLRSAGGMVGSVVSTDLAVPIGEWFFAELQWRATDETLRVLLDGKVSAMTTTVQTPTANSSLTINGGSSIPGLLAEFRYSTKDIDVVQLQRRSTRRLEEQEILDYAPYFAFEEEHLLDFRTVFDLGPEALHGKAQDASPDLVFHPSETGTRDMAGSSIPRVIGVASRLEGRRVSADGLTRRFCDGPVLAFNKVETVAGHRLWLKISQTVFGYQTSQGFFLVDNEVQPHQDLSSFQRFQAVALQLLVDSQITTYPISSVAPHAVYFDVGLGTGLPGPLGMWQLSTAAWPDTWFDVTVVGDSATGKLRVESAGGPLENAFVHSHVGQVIRIVEGGAAAKYTIASQPQHPFSEVTVSEPLFDGSKPKADVTLLEYFDAEADFDNGVIRLTDDIGDLFADVTVTRPTPQGVIEHLLQTGGADVSLPELASYATAFGVALSEESTVGSLLASSARSLDGVLWSDLGTDAWRFDALEPPASEPDVWLYEVIHVQRLDEVEPFGSLELRYRQKGSSSEWESVVVPADGTTLREDVSVLETLLQLTHAAEERAEAIFELRSGGQEVYAVDVPLRYFDPSLPFRTVRVAGAPRLADRTWRVIGLGLTVPGLCRLLLWRNLS